MGAQSDFIAETFVPTDSFKAQQLARARLLLASGLPREQVASMLSVSPAWLEALLPPTP
jgi:hypothetical protein